MHPKYLFYTDVSSLLNLHKVPSTYYVITFSGEMAHKMAILITFSTIFVLGGGGNFYLISVCIYAYILTMVDGGVEEVKSLKIRLRT